jgi:hypothetical protein
MHPIDLIRERLRSAGYHPSGERCVGSTWVVELSGFVRLPPVTRTTQTLAWHGALRVVESLGVVVRGGEDRQP